MNNFISCPSCTQLKTQLQAYYSLPFVTKAQQYLLNLIAKHQQFQTIQRLYTLQETQEQEFLDKISTKLIGGLLGETKYSQLTKGVTN